ncbi:hypothetical protein, partial [Mesorhizobium sp.]|uniref:hypothetical protein n=1 Tax=Mesorhizobium sp. TaxID=1871066 RepID=UPI00257DE5C1
MLILKPEGLFLCMVAAVIVLFHHLCCFALPTAQGARRPVGRVAAPPVFEHRIFPKPVSTFGSDAPGAASQWNG